ncbi:MAG: ATP-binding protein [Bacteroidota bacterium]
MARQNVNPSPPQKPDELRILSRTEKLSLVRDFVSEAARRVGFDEESINKIALAVDEACTNIIKHSYKFATDKEITIRLLTNGKNFEVLIEDHGISFDPEKVQPPNMKEYLSQYRRGGLGMFLMRSLMDKVEYKAYPGLRNEVHLIKYLPSK